MTRRHSEPLQQGDEARYASGDWHVDEMMATRYAAGTVSDAVAWSLEKHTENCGNCATTVSAAVRARKDTARVLADVRSTLLGALPPQGAISHRALSHPQPRHTRLLSRVIWAAGPALHGAWVVAVLLVCAGAVSLAYGADFTGARPLLLALAPLLPMAGVALSYGPSADPVHEITLATPSGGLRLLLTRCVAVLAVSLPLLTAAGAIVPNQSGAPGPATWLLPGLALTAGCLGLGSYIGCSIAAGLLAGVWSLTMLVPVLLATRRGGGVHPESALTEQLARVVSGTGQQSGWAAAAALCAVLVLLRRHAFDVEPRSPRAPHQ
ncbi:zf-HC2 domain-containing protein [Streptomyces cucumeris]|uniref:zf-HC2 domain-containing protein n=1 Tax=Streptomyces cucumeris TaxID=2962890 RepID=UPI003D74DC58